MSKHKPGKAYKGHYTAVHKTTMDTPAWRALSSVAQALFPWLRLEWKGSSANNNGKLSLSYRDAAKAMGIAKPHTIGAAFHELQAKGFIIVHEVAALGIEGMGKGFSFEITDIGMPGNQHPKCLFKDWSEGNDFPVKKAKAGNPAGIGGKTKSHAAKRHMPMPQKGTVSHIPCRETAHPMPQKGTV